VRLILATIGQSITKAMAEYESKSSRRKPADETAEVAVAAEATPAPEPEATPAA
jgi:hypothetical protein